MTIEPKVTTFKYRGRINKGREKRGGKTGRRRRQMREKRKGRQDKNNGEGWLEKGEER